MRMITQDLKNFVRALFNNEPVACTINGEWYLQGIFSRLFLKKEVRYLSIAQGLISAYDQVESIPVRFGHRQPINYDLYLQAGEKVLDLLKTCDSSMAFEASIEMMRRIVAMRYRLESSNGGQDTVQPDVNDNAYLRKLVREWKNSQDLIPDKELNDQEITRIQETVSYPFFLTLLEGSDALRDKFFRWMIRDKMDPSPFIQFPGMQQKIEKACLPGRIGRINGSFLKIQKVALQGVIKVLTLPFEGLNVSILDGKASHTFRGNYTLTIDEIFAIFADKYAHAGNLEFLGEGIINWNYLKMGWYDADSDCYHVVNVKDKKWWRQLPVFEIISLEEAKHRYGDHVNGRNWNIATAASRTSANLDYEKTHAYLNVAEPLGDGSYAIYDFGKLANEFPTNLMETFKMFALNVHASVAYPDESIFYSHRQHTYYSFPMTHEQAEATLRSIARDVITSRRNHFVYQIESDNCAKWAQEKVEHGIGEEHIPNLFQMHLLATEPEGPVSYLFAGIRRLPMRFRTWVLTRLHFFLGAFKGTWIEEDGELVYKSLSKHEFFDTGIVYLPAYLHRQQELGLIGRVIDCFERIVMRATHAIKKPMVEIRLVLGKLFRFVVEEKIEEIDLQENRVLIQKAVALRRNQHNHVFRRL